MFLVLRQRRYRKFNSYASTFNLLFFNTVAGQIVVLLGFFFWGGGNLAERNLGDPGENPRKIFEIFIPEIAANASNFKN